ncbi:MAG: hypothetical protein HYU84_06610 [Chloroflexi bacterium]|nr:hypothetical protein [Chloroflexota bacterium]
MKHMQDFYNKLTSNKNASLNRKSRLAALMRLGRERFNVVAVFDPWYVWSSESSPAMAQ